MELLLVIGLGVLVALGLWLVRRARRTYTEPPSEPLRTRLSQRAARLWWPPQDEPVPRPRWSSLPPR